MIRRRIKTFSKQLDANKNAFLWKDKMRDIPCFIIGNSPSLDDHQVYLLNGLFTIGINRAFMKIDPIILLWQDIELYRSSRQQIKNLKAILYSRDVADPFGMAVHFKLLPGPYKLTNKTNILAGNGNSAPLAFQLAHALGCNPIVFLGYDCCYRNNKTNFWGVNRDHKPHTLSACRRGLSWIINSKHNRKIIFCDKSEIVSDIMTLQQSLDFCKITADSRKDRSFFINKLFSKE